MPSLPGRLAAVLTVIFSPKEWRKVRMMLRIICPKHNHLSISFVSTSFAYAGPFFTKNMYWSFLSWLFVQCHIMLFDIILQSGTFTCFFFRFKCWWIAHDEIRLLHTPQLFRPKSLPNLIFFYCLRPYFPFRKVTWRVSAILGKFWPHMIL
jgi:hypothetical protein